MNSATSPNQEGVEGTDAEEVWMITEESAILVMSTSLIGKDLYPSLKGGTFYVCSLQATSRCAIRGIWNIEQLRNCLKRVPQSPSKWRQGTSCFMRFPFRTVLVRALPHSSDGSSI